MAAPVVGRRGAVGGGLPAAPCCFENFVLRLLVVYPCAEAPARRLHALCRAADLTRLARDRQPVQRSEAAERPQLTRSAASTAEGRAQLNPRPPEPHGVDLSGESRQRVATTRCSGHRCCESDPEDQPGIAA